MSWWSAVADLGWLGVLVPEAAGGAGLGLVDLVVLQEEMGRLPLPGPFFSSAVCGHLAVVRLGMPSLRRQLAAGRRRGTVALEEAGAGDPLRSVAATARPAGDGWELDGVKPVVLDGHTADFALVVARTTTAGWPRSCSDDPRGQAVPALDVTRKMARIDLDGRPARRIGPAGDQTALLARVIDDIAVALCAETVGACERALADGHRIRQGAGPVRPADRHLPGHQSQDRRHAAPAGAARVGTHWAAWTAEPTITTGSGRRHGKASSARRPTW